MMFAHRFAPLSIVFSLWLAACGAAPEVGLAGDALGNNEDGKKQNGPRLTVDAAWDNGANVHDLAGNLIWARVERLYDHEDRLFTQEDFLDVTAWHADDVYAPHIQEMFGSDMPHSHFALLHYGLTWNQATQPVPVLIIPGAGDNASRSAVLAISDLRHRGYSCFSLTFAHSQGDNYQQAQQIANAVARIREVTGAAQVDIIAHSKGATATSIYLSNQAGRNWGTGGDVRGTAYTKYGTRFAGDVRRFIELGGANLGVDTTYRWTAANYMWAFGNGMNAPSSWVTYYPSTTTAWWFAESLADQDFFDDGFDAFPGQRQLLNDWSSTYLLPGANAMLGAYALQQDWYTTYYGGYGFMSYSRGLESARVAGGKLIDKLNNFGLAPSVEVAIAIGNHPIIPTGTEATDTTYGAMLDSLIDLGQAGLTNFLGTFTWLAAYDSCEVQAMLTSEMLLGEVSGPSDGVVFIESATATAGLLKNGAKLLEIKELPLSHVDYLMAVPAMVPILRAQAAANPESCWKNSFADRIEQADLFGWLDSTLKASSN